MNTNQTLKILNNFFKIARSDEKITFSIIYPMLILTIKNHPDSTKSDLVEHLYNDRGATKSILDKPLVNLEHEGYIEKIPAKEKRSFHYRLTKKGAELLESPKKH